MRKHAEARVGRHDNVPPTVPSHLRLVLMSEYKHWVQVVNMTLVIWESAVHLSTSGSDEFDSQQKQKSLKHKTNSISKTKNRNQIPKIETKDCVK